MRKNLKAHIFLGKRYIVAYGQCDSPNTYQKTITVPTTGETLFDLNTIIHESLHACNFEASEKEVYEASDIISEILWKKGYRKYKSGCGKDIEEMVEIIEEVLLALKWSGDGNTIYKTSYDIARFANRIGWRRQDGETESSDRKDCS